MDDKLRELYLAMWKWDAGDPQLIQHFAKVHSYAKLIGSCSNLGDAQARRLQIRVRDKENGNYFAHTLNNTVVAPPRMLIAFLENHYQPDGTVCIPEVLWPYMGGTKVLVPKK